MHPAPVLLCRAMRRHALVLLLLPTVLPCCRVERPGRTPTGRGRDIVITAVPLLTKELAAVYPFLQQDFAPGGVLQGKEVYAFMPSSVTVIEGDTLRLRLVNPEDDEHNFVLGDLAVKLLGQSTTQATWVARRPGIYSFLCTLPSHIPLMWGQIVVLRRDAVQRTH